MNFRFRLYLICIFSSISCTQNIFETEFQIFFKKYNNFTQNDSTVDEKINSKEKLLTIFSGLLWKDSNSSIVFSNDLKTINLFKSKDSCKKELDWISKANNISMDVRPAFLHELNENENIRIICPHCSSKSMFYWHKINYEKKVVELLKSNTHIRLINDRMHIQGFRFSDTGSYICSTEKIDFNYLDTKEIIRFILLFKYPSDGIYLKNVIDMKNLELVNLTEGLEKFENLPHESYTDYSSGLVVYTSWSEWGLCGNCGGKSLRNRIGTCQISYNPPSNESKIVELEEIQRIFFPHAGSCLFNVYFKYMSEDFIKMNYFNNYNQFELCDVDCGAYESILDERAVSKLEKIPT